MEQRDVGTISHDFAGKREKIRIDLHAEHGSGLFRQSARQAAGTTADLQYQVFTTQFGRAQDHIEKVQVDEEALAEFVLEANTPRIDEVAQVRQGLSRGRLRGHHVIVYGKAPVRLQSPPHAASPT